MGIDVYLEWDGKTEADENAQLTGFSVEHGHVGYLREAYHGGPYATAVLISEDWDNQPKGGFTIPAVELKRRLPAAVMTAIYREQVVYGERRDPGHIKVEDDGLDTFLAQLQRVFKDMKNIRPEANAMRFNEEQISAAQALIDKRALPRVALSFVDFVALAERKEKETGKPCRVYVSA